jgi:very-short-patch-repair endonuclease
MRRKHDTNLALAALAADQHGVVTRAQLLRAGFSNEAVDRRVRAQRLHRLYRGVYAVGHRVLTLEGRWMAAVLACGDGAALSHRTAAAAWDLRRAGGVIHVTVRGSRRAPSGVRLHRSPNLTAAEIAQYRGIPVTSVERTIVDLARTESYEELERIVDLADERGLVDFAALKSARSTSLKAVLRNYDSAPTRSELERRFLRLCRRHGLPMPETNVLVEGYLVDFVWRDLRLIVEVDGYRYHRGPRQFEADRERDVTLSGKGWRTLRFTWRQLEEREAWVVHALRTGAERGAA